MLELIIKKIQSTIFFMGWVRLIIMYIYTCTYLTLIVNNYNINKLSYSDVHDVKTR